MFTEVVSAFRAIGADVRLSNERFARGYDPHARRIGYVGPRESSRRGRQPLRGRSFLRDGQTPVRVDVRAVDGREEFQIRYDGRGADLRVIECDRDRRHLLLSVREHGMADADKFLCGQDERHWFAAAAPARGVCSVDTAMEALMPPEVRAALDALGIRGRARYQRRTPAYVRQGEWFFLPTNESFPAELHEERLLRTAAGKAHVLQDAYRRGGQEVHVCASRDLTLTPQEYLDLLVEKPGARRWGWSAMVREPELYARGAVRHPDHATLRLGSWHRVLVNEEHRAPARLGLMFID